MPAKIEVLIALRDKISKAIDRARGKFRKLGSEVTRLGKKLLTLRNAFLAVAAFKVGQSFLSAAAKMEVFSKQLLAVSANSKEANEALAAMREFARTSPLETEDVVQSYVRLRAVGINPTLKQMKTIGGVAVLMNREMVDVLDAFIGLNKRTLRRLGIDIDRTGKKAVIASGNVRKVVKKDSASIREALIEVWEQRFPNAIETAADTFKSQMAILRSNIFEFMARLGSVFLPYMKRLVKSFATFVENQHGQLNKFAAGIFTFVAIVRTAWNGITIVARSVVSGIVQIIMAIVALGKAADKVFIGVADSFKAMYLVIERMIKEKRLDIGTLIKEEFSKVDFKAVIDEVVKGAEEIERVNRITSEQSKKDIQDIENAWKKVADIMGKDLSPGKGKLPDDNSLGPKGDPKEKPDAVKKEEKRQKELLKIKKMYQDMIYGSEVAQLVREQDLLIQKRKEFPELHKQIGTLIYENQKKINKAILEDRQKTQEEISKVSKKEKDEELRTRDAIWMANARLGSALIELTEMSVRKSKVAAEKKKRILIGLAVADAAGAAVAGVRTVWTDDSINSTWYKIAMTAVVLAEVIATTATQISALKSAKFARGTGFAPGGMSLVGEEGPEMVRLPRGSQVMTAAQTRSEMGSVNISPKIVINGNASEATVGQISGVLNDFAYNLEMASRNGHINWESMGVITQ